MKTKQKIQHKETQDQKELRNTETSSNILIIIEQIYFRWNDAHCTSLLNLNATADISSVKIHHS